MTLKLYPSGFTLPAGNTLKAQYKESCPRFFAWSKRNPKEYTEIPLLYRAVGMLAELRLGDIPGEREVPIKVDIGLGVAISGRVDLITDGCIYEIKATTSRSKYSEYISKGRVLPEHLGQLVTYLVLLSRTKGKIDWSYVHFNKARTSINFETVVFDISLVGDVVHVDGVPFSHSVTDLMRYYQIMSQAVLSDTLPPRTSNENACKWCPFNTICENNPKDLSDFNRQVTMMAPVVEPATRPPVLHCHDIRSKK